MAANNAPRAEPEPEATSAPLEPTAALEPPDEPEPIALTVQEAVAATKAAATAGHPVEVAQTFTTVVQGDEVNYRAGELIHPDDPVLARSPELFRPVVYQHPVRRRGALKTPEVRA